MTLLVASVYVHSLRHRDGSTIVPERLPANLHQQVSGYTFTRSEGGRRVFTLHADRTVAFDQGQPTVLEGVTLEVFGRTGKRHDFLRTERCEYEAQSGGILCSGKVKIELDAPSGSTTPSDASSLGVQSASRQHEPDLAPFHGRQRVYLETSKVSYQPQNSLVSSDQSIHFRFGTASGSATGFVYATQEAGLELKRDVVVVLPRTVTPVLGGTVAGAGKSEPDGTLRLSAAGLRYEKETQEVGLRGPLKITEGWRRIEADSGVIFLDHQNRVTHAVLEGGVRAFDRECKSGSAASTDRWRTTPVGVSPNQLGCDSAEILTASAQKVEGDLDPVSRLLRALIADGNVQAAANRTADSGSMVTRLSARHVQLSFLEDRRGAGNGLTSEPSNAKASGDVHLVVESSSGRRGGASFVGGLTHARGPTGIESTRPGSEGTLRQQSFEQKELVSSELLFDFAPGTGSLKEVKTAGAGTLTWIPSDSKDGKRIISAGQLLMAFDSQSRLESLRGLSGTRILLEPSSSNPKAVPQQSSADQLEARIDPATQTLATVEQSGNFQFQEADRQARAKRASYSARTQVLTRTGFPIPWDTGTRVSADRFRVNLQDDAVVGIGRVQSTHLAPTTTSQGMQQKEGVSPPVRVAGVGPEPTAASENASSQRGKVANAGPRLGTTVADDPTNVLADRMQADRKSQFVHYEGNVRAWHGYDVIESPSLDIDRNGRRISSGAGVITSHLESAVSKPEFPSSSPRGTSHEANVERRVSPLTVRADKLDYFDAERRAVYSCQVRGEVEGMTLSADRVDVYFAASPAGQVDRIVADGHITAVDPKRRVSGEHAEYLAGPGTIVMTGGHPSIYDLEQGFTSGQRLTFFIHDDSLLVDGGHQSPTISKRRAVR